MHIQSHNSGFGRHIADKGCIFKDKWVVLAEQLWSLRSGINRGTTLKSSAVRPDNARCLALDAHGLTESEKLAMLVPEAVMN